VDYINLKNIGAHVEKLNRMFEEADEQQDMTVRLAELLKTKSEEYNQCEKRQESLINRLAGDRAKRVSAKQDNNASILSLVESFQNQEERTLMVKMAEMQKRAVREEADRFESMQEWKARVLGISKGGSI
jgi:phage gpG-like protein